MSVNDIQSGMGIHSRNSANVESDDNEEFPEAHSGNRRLLEEPKTIYSTKAEIRKKEMKERAQQPLNSLCNCGSNKKYKSCCIKKQN